MKNNNSDFINNILETRKKMFHNSKGFEVMDDYYDYLDTLDDEVIQKQYNRQMEVIEETGDKYDDNLKNKNLTDLTVGIILLKTSMAKVIIEFEEFLANISPKSPVQRKMKEFFTQEITFEDYNTKKEKVKRVLKNDEIVYISIKHVFNNLYNDKRSVGNIAIDLFHSLLIAKKDSIIKVRAGGWHRKVEETTKTNNFNMRERMVNRSQTILNIEELNDIGSYSKDFKIQVGMLFISFLNNIDVIKRYQEHTGGKTKETLIFSPDIEKKMDKHNNNFRFMDVKYEPMIIKPMPWVNIVGGGYLNNDLVEGIDNIDFDILESKIARIRRKKDLLKLKDTNMDGVYNALNKIQNTAYKVNSYIYDIVDTIWKEDLNLCKIPKSNLIIVPDDLIREDYDNEELFLEELKKHRVKCAKIHTINNLELGKKITFNMKLKIIKKLKDEKEFYFPHNLDFRGRIYPIPVLFNPQGDDVSKSMMKFAEGKKLGTDGLRWLKIHVANTFGFDKESLDLREKWAEEHIDEIEISVAEPLDFGWWLDADKPLQFLAACEELINALNTDNPENFISHIPIAMDGSCSGIQHYSMMLKDEVGGKGVNLIDSKKPEDIYKDVSDEMIRLLENIVKTGTTDIKKIKNVLLKSNAVMWLSSNKINRKLSKRPVMTTPYGVGGFGIMDQLRDYLNELDGVENLLQKDRIIFIKFITEKAIDNIVIAARVGMNYIQDNVDLFFKANVESDLTTFRWTTPLGFTVTQNYKKQKQTKVETFFGTLRYTVKINKDIENKVDKNRQKSGIAPNFIHSLDATHLMMTVNAMDSNSFQVIHDSFGCHASDTTKLNKVLRQCFFDLYNEVDRLDEFTTNFKEQTLVPFDLVEKPSYGNLDRKCVLTSTYLFS